MNGLKNEGTEEPMDIEPKESVETEEKTPGYTKLLEHGIPVKTAAKLDTIFKSGKVAFEDLDERAFAALKEFPVDDTLVVLNQFVDSNLDHVSNKSAFLCGMMKTLRQKQKTPGNIPSLLPKGPDEEKIKAILERTGYSMDVTTGQRKYGGPPPGWDGPEPPNGCEVFCGKVPKELFEDELIPLFEKSGKIYDLRLMMDPLTGQNRGYAFVTFTTPEEAQQAVKDLDNHEIKPGKKLKVNITVPNLRLFVGNIPKTKDKDEIMAEFSKLTVGLTNVIIYASPDDKIKNRGFCFLEYESHKVASVAKKKLGTRPVRVWNCDILVDWADPQEEPDNETMSKVKVLYVRNLTSEFTEEKLKEEFEVFGTIERIKKLKDYAFVHYEEREHAVKAMEEMNGKEFFGNVIEIALAKPPADRRKREELLRSREKRIGAFLVSRGIMPRSGRGMRGGPRGMPMGRMPPPSYGAADYYDEGYGYGGGFGGYGNGYYDEYGYEDDYYYDYPPPPPARSGGRGAMGGMRPPPLGGRGGMRGPPVSRGGPMAGRSPRGFGPPAPRGRNMKAPLPAIGGKRKFGEAGGAIDPKRRAQSWGNQPLAQQPLGNSYNGRSDYYDDYSSWQ